MKLLNFGTLCTRGMKKIVHNDDSRSHDLTAILLADMNRHKLDVLEIQETHYGELEYLQREKGYY